MCDKYEGWSAPEDWDTLPEKSGWYAVLYGWEMEEGSFMGHSHFSAETKEWDERLPIRRWAGPFGTADMAEQFADSHDISW